MRYNDRHSSESLSSKKDDIDGRIIPPQFRIPDPFTDMEINRIWVFFRWYVSLFSIDQIMELTSMRFPFRTSLIDRLDGPSMFKCDFTWYNSGSIPFNDEIRFFLNYRWKKKTYPENYSLNEMLCVRSKKNKKKLWWYVDAHKVHTSLDMSSNSTNGALLISSWKFLSYEKKNHITSWTHLQCTKNGICDSIASEFRPCISQLKIKFKKPEWTWITGFLILQKKK